MTRHELETKFTSDIVGSDQHSLLSALVSISEILDNLLPLPVRILDSTIHGEQWSIHLVMCSIQTLIFGQSVPFFRFARWIEIQAQIEEECSRGVDPETNHELSELIYLQECRAGRHRGDDLKKVRSSPNLDYIDPSTPSLAIDPFD
jgi:hypothetical protein